MTARPAAGGPLSDAVRKAMARLCRDTYRLAGRVRLNLDEQTGRVLPEIAPADLWRALPRMLRDVATVAADVGIELTPAERDVLAEIAGLIEQGRGPAVRA